MTTGKWAVAVLLVGAIRAQTITTGEVTGTVTDTTGAVVSGPTVLLKSLDTGESRVAQSNTSGVYRFAFVKPGIYEISGSSVGLKSETVRPSQQLAAVHGGSLSVISADGGSERRIAAFRTASMMQLSPDGKTLAFVADEIRSHLILMENFLPNGATR
jgi:hypothetical protein